MQKLECMYNFDTSPLTLSITLQRGLQLRSTNENKTNTTQALPESRSGIPTTTAPSLARTTVTMDRESLATTTLCRHTRKRATVIIMTWSSRVSMDTISSSCSSSSSSSSSSTTNVSASKLRISLVARAQDIIVADIVLHGSAQEERNWTTR